MLDSMEVPLGAMALIIVSSFVFLLFLFSTFLIIWVYHALRKIYQK